MARQAALQFGARGADAQGQRCHGQHRVQAKEIAVRAMSTRRTRPAVAHAAEIIVPSEFQGRQDAILRLTRCRARPAD